MQPDFGSMLPLMVFANYDPITQAELKRYTFDAIRRWETRTNLLAVYLDDTGVKDNAVGIELHYTIKGVNSSAPNIARIPVQLDNGTVKFANATSFKLHGQRVF